MRRHVVCQSLPMRHLRTPAGVDSPQFCFALEISSTVVAQRWATSNGGSGSEGAGGGMPLFDFFGSVFSGGNADGTRRSMWQVMTDTVDSAESTLAVQFNEVLLESAGMSWPMSLVLLGFSIRLLGSLYFSLAAERATINLRRAAPELAGPVAEFDLVYTSNATAMDLTIAGAKLKAERRIVYARYNTSNRKAFLTPLLGFPAVAFGLHFVTVGLPTAYPDLSSMGTPSTWLPLFGVDITEPDASNVTGLTAMVMTVSNLELSVRNKRNGTIADPRYVWILRCVYLGFVVFPALNMPVTVQCYWVGLGLAGLLHPILMRNDAFRSWFGTPTLAVPRLDIERQQQHSSSLGGRGPRKVVAPSSSSGSFAGAASRSLAHLKPTSTGSSKKDTMHINAKDLNITKRLFKPTTIATTSTTGGGGKDQGGDYLDPETVPWHCMDPLSGTTQYSKLTNTEAFKNQMKLLFPKLSQNLDPTKLKQRETILTNERRKLQTDEETQASVTNNRAKGKGWKND